MEYEPITKEGFEGISEWIRAEGAHDRDPTNAKPDDRLLLRGIPQGCIRQITDDMGIRLSSDEGNPTVLRNPQFFDPAGLAAVRLLLLAGGALRFNTKQRSTPNRKDYIVLSGHFDKEQQRSARYLNAIQETRINTEDKDPDKIPMLRIIANTPANQTTFGNKREPLRHYSYKRSDIYVSEPSIRRKGAKEPTKTPRASRQSAVNTALMWFSYNRQKLPFKLDRRDYEELLMEAFRLQDRIQRRISR